MEQFLQSIKETPGFIWLMLIGGVGLLISGINGVKNEKRKEKN